MTSRFASLTEQDIEKIVEDKDSQNTKRSTKVAKELIICCYLLSQTAFIQFFTYCQCLEVFVNRIIGR